MAILKIRDENGNWQPIKTIKGEDGKDYIITQDDYNKIANETSEILQPQLDSMQEEIGQLDRDLTNVDNRVIALDEELQEQEQSINHLDDIKADKTEIPDVSQFIKKTVNDLTNYYLKTETYTQQEVNALIGAIKTITMKVLQEKPQTGETNIIYLIPSTKSEPENIYDEWIYVNDKWEKIGTTEIDLSNYYNKEEINQILLTRMATDMENIDEAGIEKIGEIVKDAGYVKNIDYATSDKGGTIKTSVTYRLAIDSNGALRTSTLNFEDYNKAVANAFIGKGTLENVIIGKELINKTQMEEYINSLDGNEVAY